MKAVHDTYERTIDYLRISVTDRCNLRCIYCMPTEGVRHFEFKDILTHEEITRVARIAARLGVRKIRLTGGEPLLRKNLPFLIESLHNIRGIEEIGITTNGLLLKRYAASLAAAGLQRVNVSLDSLRAERYGDITRGGDIRDVFEGIHEAERAGLRPVKINMIPIRGINDDEIEDFAMLTKYSSYQVRFIEFMPVGQRRLWAEKKYIPTREIMERVSALSPIAPVRVRKFGPARYYRFQDAPGVLGFISPISHHFCAECNRLRLTSDGKLRPCLFSEREVDVRSALRTGVPDDGIERLVRQAVEVKPKRHALDSGAPREPLKPMSSIGG
jgi:cyclic pyranopterin phosphate synthase